jgi:hypothetical protein
VLDLDDMALEFTPHTAPASAGAVNVASLVLSLGGIGLDVMGTRAAFVTGKHCLHLHFALGNKARVVQRNLAEAIDLRHPLIEQMRDNATVLLRNLHSERHYNMVKGVFAGPVAGVGMTLIGLSILLGPAMLGRFDHDMAEAAVTVIPILGASLIALYGLAMVAHDAAYLAQYTHSRKSTSEVKEKHQFVGIETEVLGLVQGRLKRQQYHKGASISGYGIMSGGVLSVQLGGSWGLAPLAVSLFTQLGTSYYGSRHVGFMSQFTPQQKMKLGSMREIMNYTWQHSAEYAVYNAEKDTKRLLFPRAVETPMPFNWIVSGVAAAKRKITKEHIIYTSARESLYKMFIGQSKVKKRFYKYQMRLFEYQLAKVPDGTSADESKRSAFWTKHQHYTEKSRVVAREIKWLTANMERDVEPWEGVFDVAHFMARRHIFDDWSVAALSNEPFRTKLMDLGVAERTKSTTFFGETKVRVDANDLVWVLRPEGDLSASERIAMATKIYEVAQKVVFTVAKRRAQDAARELIDMLVGRALLSVEENEAEAEAAQSVDGRSIGPSEFSRIAQDRLDAVLV